MGFKYSSRYSYELAMSWACFRFKRNGADRVNRRDVTVTSAARRLLIANTNADFDQVRLPTMDRIESLGNTLSNITLYDIKTMYNQVRWIARWGSG